ncbi:MAG: hypothetical protein OXC11_15430 [Rhodospirillales bacterium]|nr:hypothetical protein [Rhodospirillales bacterium]
MNWITAIAVLFVLSLVLRLLFGRPEKQKPKTGDERPPEIPSDDMGAPGDNGGE